MKVYRTESEVATMFNLRPSMLKTWRRRGVGPAFEVRGSEAIYSTAALDDYLTRCGDRHASRTVGRQYVYVFKCAGNYKIGRSCDPRKRLRAMTIQSANRISLVFAHEVKDAVEAERDLHGRYSNKLVRGEWFKLSADDLAEIERYLEAE